MTSTPRIHCWIVAARNSEEVSGRTTDRRTRAADPFIFGLITRLQTEVRAERRRRALNALIFNRRRFAAASPTERAEAEITWHDWPLDFSEPDFDAWERGGAQSGGRKILPR